MEHGVENSKTIELDGGKSGSLQIIYKLNDHHRQKLENGDEFEKQAPWGKEFATLFIPKVYKLTDSNYGTYTHGSHFEKDKNSKLIINFEVNQSESDYVKSENMLIYKQIDLYKQTGLYTSVDYVHKVEVEPMIHSIQFKNIVKTSLCTVKLWNGGFFRVCWIHFVLFKSGIMGMFVGEESDAENKWRVQTTLQKIAENVTFHCF